MRKSYAPNAQSQPMGAPQNAKPRVSLPPAPPPVPAKAIPKELPPVPAASATRNSIGKAPAPPTARVSVVDPAMLA